MQDVCGKNWEKFSSTNLPKGHFEEMTKNENISETVNA